METKKSEKTKKVIPSKLVGCGSESKKKKKDWIQYADYC
jgi:hypothetical protein